MMDRETLATITSLRILIPLILILCAVAIFLKKVQTDQSANMERKLPVKLFTAVLLGIYLLIYIHLTFTFRHPTKKPHINLMPLWSYKEAFQLSPFKIARLGLARQILMNILLTVPVGLLVPIVLDRTKHAYIKTAIIVLLLSVLTEGLQYFTHLGLCETDDLLNNLIGCLIGIGILTVGNQIINRKQKNNSSDNSKNIK